MLHRKHVEVTLTSLPREDDIFFAYNTPDMLCKFNAYKTHFSPFMTRPKTETRTLKGRGTRNVRDRLGEENS